MSDCCRNWKTILYTWRDNLVFYGLSSLYLLWNDRPVLWHASVFSDQQISLPEERKNARNLVLYSDCRRDSGDTDLFSGSIVDIHFSNDIAAWNLYWI